MTLGISSNDHIPDRMPWDIHIQGRVVDAATARRQLSNSQAHYVYVLCRPDGTPFYVGKGVNLRCFNHEAEARTTARLSHKLNVIRALTRRNDAVGYCIESVFSTEDAAHQRERELIALFGRHDQKRGPLTNQTDGGEGASNPSEESRERRRQSLWGQAEDDDRRAANTWFQRLCSVRSVPVKPLSRFKPDRLFANRAQFGMSLRQAAALVASAVANGVLLSSEAALPRRMTVDGLELAIENGVGRDLLSSRMATLVDETLGAEVFGLTSAGCAYVISAMGREILEDAGVLMPR